MRLMINLAAKDCWGWDQVLKQLEKLLSGMTFN
jgi:hypothetical protein